MLRSLFINNPVFFAAFPLFLYAQFAVASSAAINALFYVLVLPAWGYYLYQKRDLAKPLFTHPASIAAGLFFTYVIFHAVFTADLYPDASKVIRNTLVTSAFFFIATSFFAFTDMETRKNLIRRIAWVSGICAVVSIGIYLATAPHNDPRMIPLGRADTQVLAAFVYSFGGICALFALTQAHKRRVKAALLACIVADFATILLTQSRMAIAVFLLCILIGGLFFGRHNRLFALALPGFTVIALLAGIPLFLGISPLEYGMELIARGDSFRLELWELTLQKIRENPWLGHGMMARIDHPITHSPHNIFLATALALGLPGLALLVLVLAVPGFYLLCQLIRRPEATLFILLLLGNGIASGLIDHSRIAKGPSPLWIIFWLPVAVAVGELIRQRLGQRPELNHA